MRNNRLAKLPKVGYRISTCPAVFAMLTGECRFNSCSGPQKKIAVVLQNFKRINTGVEGNFNG